MGCSDGQVKQDATVEVLKAGNQFLIVEIAILEVPSVNNALRRG
jgi:hypothetical protein